MADVLPVPVKNLLKLIGIDRFVIVIASWQGPGIVRIVAKVCEVLIRCRHDQSSGVCGLIGQKVSLDAIDCATEPMVPASDILDERPE